MAVSCDGVKLHLFLGLFRVGVLEAIRVFVEPSSASESAWDDSDFHRANLYGLLHQDDKLISALKPTTTGLESVFKVLKPKRSLLLSRGTLAAKLVKAVEDSRKGSSLLLTSSSPDYSSVSRTPSLWTNLEQDAMLAGVMRVTSSDQLESPLDDPLRRSANLSMLCQRLVENNL